AERNGVALAAVRGDWGSFEGSFDLVLGADLLYEERNGEALLETLPSLAPRVLLAEPGRATSAAFFEEARRDWEIDEDGERVSELTGATRGDRRARADG